MTGHAILVLGSNRSGTSLVARGLTCLGAEIGPRATWSAPDNPSGFWEDLDVLALDERVLLTFNRTWDDIEPLPPCFENHAALRHGLGIDARALLRSRLAAHPLWGVKEPRMCRLLPFWRKAFEEVGCRVSVVFVVRHPLAVAASLWRRNFIRKERALKLWLRYTIEAREGVSPTWPTTTLLYDSVVLFPTTAVQQIGDALGLPVDPEETRRFATEFVDDTLWHEDSEDDEALPVEVRAVWEMERAKAMRGQQA